MRPYVLGLLLCLAAPAGGADFYVDPVNGSDGGDGSAAQPWRTLQTVLQANLIETRNWESLPYQPGLNLVPINVGAPVKAGDTLWWSTSVTTASSDRRGTSPSMAATSSPWTTRPPGARRTG